MKFLKSQRGAMFGLDARIALAIFGGLSVVAGASIVSVLRDTDSAALATELDNVQKGYIHYVLENSDDTLTIANVIGTYVQGTTDHPDYGTYDLIQGDHDDSAADLAAASAGGNVCGDEPCFVYLRLTHVDVNVVRELERKYDDADTASGTVIDNTDDDDGVIRWEGVGGSDTSTTVIYQLSRALPA